VFEGVISGDGKWKLHLPHKYRQLVKAGNDGAAGVYRQTEIGLSLYDMEKDPYETTNVLDAQPEVAAKMQAFAAAHRREFYSVGR
jgi:arylsulfatase A